MGQLSPRTCRRVTEPEAVTRITLHLGERSVLETKTQSSPISK